MTIFVDIFKLWKNYKICMSTKVFSIMNCIIAHEASKPFAGSHVRNVNG